MPSLNPAAIVAALSYLCQLCSMKNFLYFVMMSLIQVFHCHFNSSFMPLFVVSGFLLKRKLKNLVIASERSFPFILLSTSDGPLISPPSSQQFLLPPTLPKTRNLPRHSRFVRYRPATAQLYSRSSRYQVSPGFCSLHCRCQSSLANCNFHFVK